MKGRGHTACLEIKTRDPLPAKLLLPSPSHTAPPADTKAGTPPGAGVTSALWPQQGQLPPVQLDQFLASAPWT